MFFLLSAHSVSAASSWLLGASNERALDLGEFKTLCEGGGTQWISRFLFDGRLL